MQIDLNLGDTKLIRKEAKGLPVEQVAYILATAYWETARTIKPVEEAYYLGAKAAAYQKKLRYYPYYGRGYVQLTWKDNYIKAGNKLGYELVSYPELALQPDISAKVLVTGMVEGWFTGKKLSDYFGNGKKDYRNARRIINGTDKMNEIAVIAEAYEAALRADEKPTNWLSILLANLAVIFGGVK